MATSSKFDLPSGSPDRPLYTTGQRGPHIAAPLDRSSSFRENMDNPILSSLPNMSRSSSTVTQENVVKFMQCLRFDPKLLVAEHKSNRQLDFRRHVSAALSISPEDSPSGSSKGKQLPSLSPEDVKRVRASLHGSFVKARERVKVFNESLSVFNQFFPSIPSKKRSRLESFANDRSSVLPSDRSVLGPTVGKMGNQSHTVTGGFELEQQKLEERTKNSVPNKRTRTSLVDVRMDVRSNALVRPSGAIDRDREILRPANGGAVHTEDRSLPIGGDGWEKSKMKKKRSGIKPDVSPSTVSNKPIDGYREAKQGIQQRPVADARSRLSGESHGFRPGVLNGAVGVGKSDVISQQIGLGMRSSIPRTDPDNTSLTTERRDRPVGSDKERVNLRTVNKPNVREDFNSASPTSTAKMNSSIRAPRSSSGVAPKLSSVVPRSNVPNDWELSTCSNKPPAAVGANNRKRMASTRSSSPPVAWAGQRPQKISRTARRTNFPIVPNNDETPALDSGSDIAGNEIGLGFARRLPGSSPQQVKLKGDTLSSATLSESEESGAVETKSRDKSRKSEEIDEKAGQNIQKVSTLVLPSRKNKAITGEELGDGVRRQGRTGRGFTSTRSLMPMTVEKLGNVGTAKQLRSARHGFDKTESKAGRPPTRKLSDRKAYARQKHTGINAAADFLVGSDDGHEELLAAANAVISHARSFTSPFWRQMEPFFGFITDADISFLKQQGNLDSASTPIPHQSTVLGCSTVPNGFGFMEHEPEMEIATDKRSNKLLEDQLGPGSGDQSLIPLCQRLVAALISEEDCNRRYEDLKCNEFEMDGELEANSLNDQSLLSFQFAGPTALVGYRITGKAEQDQPERNIVGILNMGMNSSFGHSPNGLHSDESLMPRMACSEFQYENLQINEKILLELQSIDIFPEPVPDMSEMQDEGITDEISRLEEKYRGQVSKKKGLLDRLLKSSSATKDDQEKEFEERALDKLVGMASEKYMSCWGPHGTGGKSSSNKLAKQAALAFVKRTLEHYHKFENTGKSCFSEPLFKDIFLSGSSNLNVAQLADTTTEGESTKPYASIRSLEASLGSQQSPSHFCRNTDNHDINSLDVLTPVNHLSEQITGREDTWSNRVKKRELLLDDVGGSIGTSNAPSSIGGSLSSSAKGKRSERDRDGKGHSREMSSRNGTTKIGRPALSNVKGERKSKTKPKQKTTQLSVSVNGLVGKISEQPKPALPSVSKSNEITTSSNVKEKDRFGLNVLDDPESLDLSNLQLPGMDVLGVPDDLGGQGQDLGSWLNIDDEGLQDHDFMGLEIPMDDLSDLNMMV